VTPEQLHILQHALGLDQYGQGTMYRNHYVGGERECRPLVAMGYMIERPASELTGGAPLFHVTEAGKTAVREQSPKPPKLTRSQKRYREYLKVADLFDGFGQWLKYEKARRQAL
jgi:hypothetical protein